MTLVTIFISVLAAGAVAVAGYLTATTEQV